MSPPQAGSSENIVERVPVLVDPLTDEMLLEEPVARRVLELIQGTAPSCVEQTPVYAFQARMPRRCDAGRLASQEAGGVREAGKRRSGQPAL
jgi:hypothetical protein